MLTITGIVKYRKPQTKVRGSDGKFDKAAYTKLRRARARELGKCGICASRWPQPGLATCDGCLRKRKRNTSDHSIVADE